MDTMISVVLLTKDGGPLLRQVVRQLQRQSLAHPIEIVAVDSGSTDGTVEFLAEVDVRVTRISPREFRFGPTRQFAFSKTNGEIIVTLSQDVLPFDEHYLARLINPIITGEAEVVRGRTVPPEDLGVFYWEECKAFYFTSEGSRFFAASGGIKLSCCSLAMTRDAWLATGFGDTPFCEDKLIQARMLRTGVRMRVLPDPIAWHGHRYSLLSLAKRCHNEGVGWRHISVKYTMKEFLVDICLRPWSFRRAYWKGIKTQRIHDLAGLLFFQVRPICLFIGNRLIPRYWA